MTEAEWKEEAIKKQSLKALEISATTTGGSFRNTEDRLKIAKKMRSIGYSGFKKDAIDATVEWLKSHAYLDETGMKTGVKNDRT